MMCILALVENVVRERMNPWWLQKLEAQGFCSLHYQHICVLLFKAMPLLWVWNWSRKIIMFEGAYPWWLLKPRYKGYVPYIRNICVYFCMEQDLYFESGTKVGKLLCLNERIPRRDKLGIYYNQHPLESL